MKTYLVIGVVAAAHCAAIGCAFLMQGCGSPDMGENVSIEPVPVVMPPGSEGPETDTPAMLNPGASVEDTAEVRAWPRKTSIYVVKKGEVLSQIARRFDISVSEIAALNNIKNVNKIRAGLRLVLPGKAATGSAGEPSRSTDAGSSERKTVSGGNLYVVVSGDTLSEIAARHGITVSSLKQANGLKSDMIYAGQKLTIPGGGSTSAGSEPVETGAATDDDAEESGSDSFRFETDDEISDVSATEMSFSVRTREITVREGDDLTSIASQWAVSAEELKRLNGLDDGGLTPGQKLKIPLAE
mgnify:CR=1 FL=1